MAADAHDRSARAPRATTPGSRSGGPTRTPGCWSSPAPACGPRGRRRSTGSSRRTRPRACGCCWASRTAGPGSPSIVPAGAAQAEQDAVVPAARTAAAPRPATSARGARRWSSTRSAWPSGCGRPASARAAAARCEVRGRRPRAGLRRLRHVAVPAHRPGRDHGRRLTASPAPRTSAACSAARPSGPRGASRRWPASASRGRPSRTPYAGRSSRRPGSSWGTSSTSATSRGRSRPA